MSTVVRPSQLRVQFFDYLFGNVEGNLCISYASKDKVTFRDKFFPWPSHRAELANFIESIYEANNVWFCVSLLNRPERKKEYCLPSSIVWADLDFVNPDIVEPTPSSVIRSSADRYQAFWRLDETVPPDVAEDFSRRIAYSTGADKSGWDMVQLLRVPFTKNHKYDPPQDVELTAVHETLVPTAIFDAIDPPFTSTNGDIESISEEERISMPDPNTLPDVQTVLYKYKSEKRLSEDLLKLYSITPTENDDWSKRLWRLINMCFEAGMGEEETFVVALHSESNKYKRDNRPLSYLWRDVKKASLQHNSFKGLLGVAPKMQMPILVDPDTVEEDSFIREYKQWAIQATDAPEQYHELTAFIAMSAMVSAGLYLKVEWGEVTPNLWGLILGESTLTRKTTAMRLMIDMVKDIDETLILATDGSAEGLMTGLSNRPKRVSIFWKDEVSGLFDSINRKDYLAGLPETLTQLYDVPKVLTRLLRKETVTISEPYFIFFGGGIRDKVYSLINDEYILSGFLPRFLVVSGENDLSRLRRTGPPSIISTERKDNIARTLTDLRDAYNISIPTTILGQQVNLAGRIEARLTDEAWLTYQVIEDILTKAGYESDMQMVALPMFQRLSFSLLKMSLLVAASRREPTSSNHLTVEAADVRQAAFYIQKWGGYSIDLLMNTGKSMTEKLIEKTLHRIRAKPGITKSEIMQRQRLMAKDARDLIDTMSERGLIRMEKSGPGIRLFAVE